MGFATTLTKNYENGDVLIEVSWFDGAVAHHADTTVRGIELRAAGTEEAYLAGRIGDCYHELFFHLDRKAKR